MQDYLAVGFTIGLTIIYLPQYYKIIRMKSSIGFHPWFVYLGYMACTFSSINAIIYYWGAFVSYNALDDLSLITGFILLLYQWLLFLIFYIVFLIYFKDTTLSVDEYFEDAISRNGGDGVYIDIPVIYQNPPSGANRILGHIKKSRLANLLSLRSKGANIGLFIVSQVVCICLILTTCLLLAYLPEGNMETISVLSVILEVFTLTMFCSHYLPQIWETYHSRQVGSLSLITLGLMCPGTFVWTYFLASQNSAMSVWLPYLFVGLMQVVLFIIASRNQCKSGFLMASME